MTVSEGRRMHTKSLRRIINLLKGRPNINLFILIKALYEWTLDFLRTADEINQ